MRYWEVEVPRRYTDLVRQIAGIKVVSKGNRDGYQKWKIPAAGAAAVQCINIGVYNFMDDATASEVNEAQHYLMNRLQNKKTELSLPYYDDRLSPLQRVGVGWLTHDSGILADQMGTGKTVQTAAAMSYYEGPHLVVTTKSTVGVWMRHIEDWTPFTPIKLHGTAAQRRKQMEQIDEMDLTNVVVVTTHGMARTHSRIAGFYNTPAEGENGWLNRHWSSLTVDEVHKFRDPKGKTIRALREIASTSARRWALTGTPIESNPDDLWVILNLVKPAWFPVRKAYRDRYCHMEKEYFGGYTNKGVRQEMQDEFKRITEPYLLRRMRSQVFPELPEAMPTQYRELEMTPAQAKVYRQLATEMMTEVDGEFLMVTDPLVLHSRLDYVASGTPVIEDGKITGLTTPSNKLEAILDIYEERDGDPFVVFAPSSKVIDMLAEGATKKNLRVGKITGKIGQEQRDAYVKLFQEGKLDILFLTSAGAEGITLTYTDLLVYADLSWEANINEQVADRIDRPGQERPPQRIVLMSEGTIDVSRRKIVELKKEGQQAILRDVERLKDVIQGKV